MFKQKICLFFLVFFWLFSTLSSPFLCAQSFEEYRQTQQKSYQNYRQKIQRDFESYQKITQEEFGNYRKAIRKSWGDQKMSTQKEWVNYTADMKMRTTVNFEENTIVLEIQDTGGKEEAQKRFREKLGELITTTQEKAFEMDVPAKNIEKRLQGEPDTILRAPLDTKPILAESLTGETAPSPEKIRQTVQELSKNTEQSERKLSGSGVRVHTFSIRLPEATLSSKTKNYEKEVLQYGKERKIDPALIFAVMHTESAFNPMATSHVPAYGLMQIVPKSAGKDASELVYGEQKLLSPSYLYNPDNNIKIGTAYLHILFYRYLSAIENRESRLYCTIAAYNTGAGNVARAFTGSTNAKKAAVVINTMTPDQVYEKLVCDLPYQETRNYMQKLTPRYKAYQTQYPNLPW